MSCSAKERSAGEAFFGFEHACHDEFFEMVGDLAADITIDEFNRWNDGLVAGWVFHCGNHAAPRFAVMLCLRTDWLIGHTNLT